MEDKISTLGARDFFIGDITMRGRIRGTSMLPLVRDGDCVLIKPACEKEIRIGDILAYAYIKDAPVICHRFVIRDNPYLITKGDTHIRGYEKITFENLLGRVVLIERGSKTINLETSFQKGLAVKIAWISFRVPILLYIIAYAIEVFRNPGILLRRIRRAFKGRDL